MRDIKFRAWDKKDAFMLFSEGWTLVELTANYAEWRDKDLEWLESTGLTDSKGTLIFEGDVLQSKSNSTFNGNNILVEWQERFACIEFKDAKDEHPEAWYPNNRIDGPKVTVIGNRFEHPELLGESK